MRFIEKFADLLSSVALSVPGLTQEMNEAQVASPLRSQALDTQRKRAQIDRSGGPPRKKQSFVTQAWWTLKSMLPWSRNNDEEEEERVVNVEEEEDEEDDEEVIEEEEEQEDPNEVEVINDEDDDDVIAVPVQPSNIQRVPAVVTLGRSTEEEEQVIRREVREEQEVLVIETPEKTTTYIRRITPPSGGSSEARLVPQVFARDSPPDSDPEVVEIAPTPSGSSSRVYSSFSGLPPTLTGLTPEVTNRVMEYVTEQSSRVVTAHSPSQSSTTSFDRERLRVGEEEGERDSPRPEDSASRQVTPKSAIGVERSAYPGYKRDTWKKGYKREREIRIVGRGKGIVKNPRENQTKKAVERLRTMNSQLNGESNPFNEDAKQRYINILQGLASRSGMSAPAGKGQLANSSFSFAPILSNRKTLTLEDHTKRLALGKKMALDVIEGMFPRGKKETELPREHLDNEVAGPFRDTTIVLDESSRYSSRSPNASLSFHSVDKLADLQSRIHEMSLISTSGKLQFDLYKGSKAEFDQRVERLGEEGKLRTQHRLETERLHHIDARARLALQGIIVPLPEKAVDEFPDLSEEAEQLCRRAWVRGIDGEKFRGGDPPLCRRDLMTLNGLNWLNDEIILAYMNLIVERSKLDKNLPPVYAFNTFFYGNISNPAKGFATVKRWTRKVDVFSFDILLIPVHLSVHWTMAVVDVSAKSIHFYDSLGGRHGEVSDNIMRYLEAESMDKRKIPLDASEWELVSRSDIPHQHNGSDCGVFACKFADFAARRAPVTFDQSHMPYYRKRMVYQLCQSDLNAH